MILGDSFIRRLNHFIVRTYSDLGLQLNLSGPATIRWHGVRGRTVAKTISNDLGKVRSFSPDIEVLQLGTNDLTRYPSEQVGSEIEDFVRLLHDSCDVKLVCVCQTVYRNSAEAFNKKVNLLTRYLKVVLEPLPYAIFWGHRGFWKAKQDFYAYDGVHFNTRGQYKFFS